MFGQTNADTMAVQKESVGPAVKKPFIPYKKKKFGGASVPKAGTGKFEFGNPPQSDGLDMASIMGK
jgi:hypothetical protein